MLADEVNQRHVYEDVFFIGQVCFLSESLYNLLLTRHVLTFTLVLLSRRSVWRTGQKTVQSITQTGNLYVIHKLHLLATFNI